MLLGLGASVGLTAFGLVCQTRGLKDGNSVVVCTCGNVSQMITAVIFGVVILGERLPTSTWTALRNWCVYTLIRVHTLIRVDVCTGDWTDVVVFCVSQVLELADDPWRRRFDQRYHGGRHTG